MYARPKRSLGGVNGSKGSEEPEVTNSASSDSASRMGICASMLATPWRRWESHFRFCNNHATQPNSTLNNDPTCEPYSIHAIYDIMYGTRY